MLQNFDEGLIDVNGQEERMNGMRFTNVAGLQDAILFVLKAPSNCCFFIGR